MDLWDLMTEVITWLELLFLFLGAVVLTYGGIDSIRRWVASLFKKEELHKSRKGRETIRAHFGTYLLLSLEFFIAADLLRTIMDPYWEEIAILAAIVGIRTVISIFLNLEIKYFK
jgi:uncharacterized membrane protein